MDSPWVDTKRSPEHPKVLHNSDWNSQIKEHVVSIIFLINTFPPVLKIHLYDFWLEKFKNNISIALKPTGFKLWANPINFFLFFWLHYFKYYKLDVVKKWA